MDVILRDVDVIGMMVEIDGVTWMVVGRTCPLNRLVLENEGERTKTMSEAAFRELLAKGGQ